jgi:hypothetical protein
MELLCHPAACGANPARQHLEPRETAREEQTRDAPGLTASRVMPLVALGT